MMRLIKFLLGLTVGAAAGVLFAPKSGRQLREQLLGGAAAKLLPPIAELYPLPNRAHTEPEDTVTWSNHRSPRPFTRRCRRPRASSKSPQQWCRRRPARHPLGSHRGDACRGRGRARRAVRTCLHGESAPAAEPPLYWELAPEAVAAEEPAREGREPEDLGVSEADQTAAPCPSRPRRPPPAVKRRLQSRSRSLSSEPIAEARGAPDGDRAGRRGRRRVCPQPIAAAENLQQENLEPVAVAVEESVPGADRCGGGASDGDRAGRRGLRRACPEPIAAAAEESRRRSSPTPS